MTCLAMLCLLHPRSLLAFSAATAHCWLMVSLVSIRTPWSFPSEQPSASHFSSLVPGVIPYQAQVLAIPFHNLYEATVSPAFQHPKVPQISAQPHSATSTLPCIICKPESIPEVHHYCLAASWTLCYRSQRFKPSSFPCTFQHSSTPHLINFSMGIL